MPSRLKILGRSMMLVPVVLVVSLLVLNPSRLFHRAMFSPRPLTIIVRTPSNLRSPDQIQSLVARLRANNVKAVWVQFKQDETDEFESGQAFYPSRIAPVAKGYDSNVIGRFVDALVTAGVDVYAWVPTLHDGSAVRAHPDWAAQIYNEDEEMLPNANWLCPANPDAVKYEASIAAEVARQYPKIKGLYLDFVRYDSDFACTCPRCLQEVARRSNWALQHKTPLTPLDIIDAGNRRQMPWPTWLKYRAESICGVVATVSKAVREAKGDCFVGASVLPFSAKGYSTNTQSGQDLHALSQAGLDELAVMGYWDDWSKSPAWVSECMKAAAMQVKAPCRLSCIVDGDMAVRRTRLSLDGLDDYKGPLTFFRYDEWSDRNFLQLRKGVDGHDKDGKLPRPEKVDVVIRIDTEPDAEDRFDTIRPEMIDKIARLLESEGVRGTFVTCARVAAEEQAVVRAAAAHGHEIAVHAYEHEQLDSLPPLQQMQIIDKSLQTYQQLGVPVHGFGAPRNSGTDFTCNREIEWNLEYDGSESYDPAAEFEDVSYHYHDGNTPARIVVVPYIEPNDWDASQVNPEGMLAEWQRRLDLVIEGPESCFVLDIHQWLACQGDNLDTLRQFIQYAKTKPQCRFVTLREAAKDARSLLDQYELPCPTSGDTPGPFAQRPPLPTTLPATIDNPVVVPPVRPAAPEPARPAKASPGRSASPSPARSTSPVPRVAPRLTVENRDRPSAKGGAK